MDVTSGARSTLNLLPSSVHCCSLLQPQLHQAEEERQGSATGICAVAQGFGSDVARLMQRWRRSSPVEQTRLSSGFGGRTVQGDALLALSQCEDALVEVCSTVFYRCPFIIAYAIACALLVVPIFF